MSRSEYQHLYKSKGWRDLRASHLLRNPLCARCWREGHATAATVVHHITAHKGDRTLFENPHNLESLCAPCHNGAMQSIERRGYDKTVGADGWPVDPHHHFNSGVAAPPPKDKRK